VQSKDLVNNGFRVSRSGLKKERNNKEELPENNGGEMVEFGVRAFHDELEAKSKECRVGVRAW
jgi:hypothetical protein